MFYFRVSEHNMNFYDVNSGSRFL